MDPQIIHLILCDNVRIDRSNYHRLDVRGLQVRLRARQTPPVKQEFCILLVLAGFRGSGLIWFRVVDQATDARVAESVRWPVTYPRDPEQVLSLVFRLRECSLPRYGRYRVEFWDGDQLVGMQPFWLMPPE